MSHESGEICEPHITETVETQSIAMRRQLDTESKFVKKKARLDCFL